VDARRHAPAAMIRRRDRGSRRGRRTSRGPHRAWRTCSPAKDHWPPPVCTWSTGTRSRPPQHRSRGPHPHIPPRRARCRCRGPRRSSTRPDLDACGTERSAWSCRPCRGCGGPGARAASSRRCRSHNQIRAPRRSLDKDHGRMEWMGIEHLRVFVRRSRRHLDQHRLGALRPAEQAHALRVHILVGDQVCMRGLDVAHALRVRIDGARVGLAAALELEGELGNSSRCARGEAVDRERHEAGGRELAAPLFDVRLGDTALRVAVRPHAAAAVHHDHGRWLGVGDQAGIGVVEAALQGEPVGAGKGDVFVPRSGAGEARAEHDRDDERKSISKRAFSKLVHEILLSTGARGSDLAGRRPGRG
jgi:hypothetical protein